MLDVHSKHKIKNYLSDNLEEMVVPVALLSAVSVNAWMIVWNINKKKLLVHIKKHNRRL